MSNWYNEWVLPLVGLVLPLTMTGPVLAQDADNQAEQKAERVTVSTGMGSESVAVQRPDDVVRLDLEGDETGLALFEPELRTPVKGAVLMLADEGQPAGTNLLTALGEPFKSSGWAVMTVGLETPPYAVQQFWRHGGDRSDRAAGSVTGDENAESVMINVMEDGDLGDLETRYNDRVQSLLDAASADLRQRGYDRVVLVALGQGVVHMARFASGNDGESEMVWIAPWFYPGNDQALNEMLAGRDGLSVLHLHSARQDSNAATMLPSERAVRLRDAGIGRYQTQAVAMRTPPGVRNAGALANRIQAWLNAD
ncbi:DUF3530 family protein [Marinobacter sp. HN1S83]|uniref:DUF3530 family protein n=1 Tax=Marinobacter sp. HN1S83 TaxID=3382301 RepID=UPI00387B44A8